MLSRKEFFYYYAKKKIVRLLVLLGVALLFFTKATQYRGLMNSFQDKIFILQSKNISGRQASEMQSLNSSLEKQYAFTIWGEMRGVKIFNPDLKRDANVDQLVISGRSDIILESTFLLETKDKQGCLIDSDTAYALFGDPNTINQIVLCNNETYVVRGIVKNMKNVFVVQTSDKAEEMLDTITVLRNEETTDRIVKNLTNMLGMNTQLVDWGLLIDFTSILFLTVPIFLSLYFLLQINIYKKHFIMMTHKKIDESNLKHFLGKYPLRYWIFFGIQLLYFILFTTILLKNVSFIENYIPTQWSDFVFWAQLLKEKNNNLETLLIISKKKPELLFCISFLKANVCNFLAFFFVIILSYELRVTRTK